MSVLQKPNVKKPWRSPGSNLRHRIGSRVLLLSQIPIYDDGDLAELIKHSTLLLLLFAGTIFCDSEKNRKIKYPQKFLPTYQSPWVYTQSQTAWWFSIFDHAWSFSFDAFLSAFSFLPSHAIRHHELEKVTFDDIDDCGSFTSEI